LLSTVELVAVYNQYNFFTVLSQIICFNQVFYH